jgi:hypothetical protein
VRIITETTSEGIIRSIAMRAAYGWENPPKGNHNVTIFFTVQRGDAAVQWDFNTGWYPKELRAYYKRLGSPHADYPDGLGAIYSHHAVQLSEYDTRSENCDLLSGRACYSGASFTASGGLFERMTKDPAAIWAELERRLKEIEQEIAQVQADIRNFS